MGKILQDIWILSESGAVLFHRLFDGGIDDQLFGALMTALNTFAEELSSGGLSNFELKNKRFTIIKKYNLLFIATSDIDIKNKKIARELEIIALHFYTQFFLILEDWDGEITYFVNFAKEIEDSLQMDVQKFHEAFL